MKKIIISAFILFATSMAFAEPHISNKKSCMCGKESKGQALLATFQSAIPKGMSLIPSGIFMMGGHDSSAKKDELPLHPVKISAFYMDKTKVSNREFAEFVRQTHYVTTAEKPVDWNSLKKQLPPGTPKPPEKKLAPGSLVFIPTTHPVNLDDPSQWWKWVIGANWRHPLGPKSKIFGWDHPVVQVSWFDANAYCRWAGKRLPTEAEREWAARGGLKNKIYPWGNEDIDSGKIKANIWQGNFPYQNTQRDGYYWTSPVKKFPPNGYGLYDMSGNAWEWTADLYDANYYAHLKKLGLAVNPRGPEKSYDPDDVGVKKYALRGGSFLCNKSYCKGYRVSARMKTSPDTSLVNVGFRCAKDLPFLPSA